MRSWKKTVAIVAGLAMLGSTAACGTGDSSSSKVLNLLVEGGGPAETVARNTAAEFKKQTGYTVKIDTVPYSGLYDKLKAETDSGRAIHDLAVIDIGWFPALAKGLSSVNGVLTSSEEDDFMPGLKDGGTVDGTLLGIPTWTNAQVLLYRKDLFENAKNKKEFKEKFGYELAAPRTWEQFRDAAKFFTKDGMHGTSLVGQTGADSVTQWLEFAEQAGARNLVVSKNKSTLNQTAYKEALDYMHTLVKDGSIPSDYLSEGVSEISNLFNQGKIAMELTWSHFYKASAKALSSDKVGVVSMIGGKAGIGAIPGPWYEVILKRSPKQDIAKKYLKFMYGKNSQYMEALGVAARKSVFTKYEGKEGYAHLKPLEETLEAKQTQNRPAIKAWTQIETEVLSPLVQSGLKNGGSEDELQKGANKINETLN